MKGSYNIVVKDKKTEYNLTIRRKYTIINGESCEGKSKFFRMLDSMNVEKKVVPLDDKNEKVELIPMPRLRNTYERLLPCKEPTIFVIDEHIEGYADIAFKDLMKASNAYFIIISRKPLLYERVLKSGKIKKESLPVSISEVYTIKSEIKKNELGREYYCNRFVNTYKVFDSMEYKFDMVITEDSNSGYEIYSHCFKDAETVTAGGNANVLNCLRRIDKEYHYDNYVAVFVDGAAYGAYIKQLVEFIRGSRNKIVVYAPESTEWLLLKAIPTNNFAYSFNENVLINPQNYCDKTAFSELINYCKDFTFQRDIDESWERLFTNYLMYLMSKTPFPYSKKGKCNPFYFKFIKNIKDIIDNEL